MTIGAGLFTGTCPHSVTARRPRPARAASAPAVRDFATAPRGRRSSRAPAQRPAPPGPARPRSDDRLPCPHQLISHALHTLTPLDEIGRRRATADAGPGPNRPLMKENLSAVSPPARAAPARARNPAPSARNRTRLNTSTPVSAPATYAHRSGGDPHDRCHRTHLNFTSSPKTEMPNHPADVQSNLPPSADAIRLRRDTSGGGVGCEGVSGSW